MKGKADWHAGGYPWLGKCTWVHALCHGYDGLCPQGEGVQVCTNGCLLPSVLFQISL